MIKTIKTRLDCSPQSARKLTTAKKLFAIISATNTSKTDLIPGYLKSNFVAQFCELFKKAITDFKLIVFPFCSASVELIFGETVVNILCSLAFLNY